MPLCASCEQPIDADEASRTFVWLGFAMDPYGTDSKPDVHVHERCLPSWQPPDPYYHDMREPFPDSGM
jgi:hypothetical protein